ncbi:MAG TPA: ParA family protein [Pyrinomonadaceae bacterium]|nr:ParA family protein [Pyrinomonadaceae bacterium]
MTIQKNSKQLITNGLRNVLTNISFDEMLNAKRFNPKKKTRVIAICLSKGGVGKTTSAANLAHGLARSGRKVLLIDTDRQAQTRLILGCQPLLGTYDFTHPEKDKRHSFEDCVHIDKERPLLHFLSGSESLDYWERKAELLAAEEELNPFIKYEHIRNAFSEIEDRYDYLIFDTPPGIGLIGHNVLFYATELLIPTFLSRMSEDSVEKFLDKYSKISDQRKRLNLGTLYLKYFLPTFKTNTTVSKNKFEELQEMCETIRETANQREGLKKVRLMTPIPMNTKLNELPDFGQTIFEHAPLSSGAQTYGMLVEEILKDE